MGTLEGGNLLRTTPTRFVPQESRSATLLVATADPPNGGSVTVQAVRDRLDGFTVGHGQDDAGLFDLKEGALSAAGYGLQEGYIGHNDRQGSWLSSTYGIALQRRRRDCPHHTSPRICCTTSCQTH
ncbi:hypothetical protein FRUB_06197 [Fimbriiglobus ruber]|uniref:Uncharacterized protein n=1 Tax=Fimbriiglobus ruber TaxID=1908690 RepID=A0A225DRV4_9BACT|nr:hypothetical protein FRUB_06197 [Fimbriiglobus ruber]